MEKADAAIRRLVSLISNCQVSSAPPARGLQLALVGRSAGSTGCEVSEQAGSDGPADRGQARLRHSPFGLVIFFAYARP